MADRFVWDGDQLLYELRVPGGAADNLDLAPYGGSSRFYGTVGYIHGRALDQPLALHDSAGRVPVADARGQYEGFLRPTGAGADCQTAPGAGCWTISWASKRTGAGFQTWGGAYPDVPDEWRGGVIQNQTDRAGLAYKRNRYYDPSTGRFTQVDPIGLGGGTNVYGFASGDPVNFSDPFGLWPCPELCGAGGAGGAIALGRVGIGVVSGATIATTAGMSLAALVFLSVNEREGRPDAVVGARQPADATSTRGRDIPAKGEPNSTDVRDDGKGNGQIRDYGNDGKAKTDFDFGHDHTGAGDPHAHDWDWTKSPPRQPPRAVRPGEASPRGRAP